MAATHWYTGKVSETTATVIVRCSSDESATVAIDGQSINVNCFSAVNDGNAVATFTGLAPGQRYTYTVNGGEGGTLRTKPVQGPFWLAFSSCWNIARADALALQLLQAPLTGANIALHTECVNSLAGAFLLGDLVYMNSAGTINGYAQTLIDGGSLANGKLIEARRQYYRAGRLTDGIRKLMRNVPSYILIDDHEHDPDNACYDVAWVDAKYGGINTQADLDAIWSAARGAWREWTLGNPDREVTGSVLTGPDCFRVRFGHVEIWCTDLILERTYHGTIDSSSKRMMSAAQEEWLLSTMHTSDAKLKIWASTKQFISSCGRNGDGWYNLGGLGLGYQTQLQRILSDTRFPRSGALSITGDEHIYSDLWVAENRLGGTHAAISQASAGPATIAVITDPDDGLAYTDGVRSKERDTTNAAQHGENNYMLLRVLSNKIERYRLGSRYGLRYMGYVGTEDNLIRY